MWHCCNSGHGRNLLVIVLRINKSVILAESIVTLHDHKPALAQHQLLSLSTLNTPQLACPRQCLRWHFSVAPNLHHERRSPQTAGDLNILNDTILNTIKLYARRIRLYRACPIVFNLLSLMNWTLKEIHSMTWMYFPTLNTLKTLHTRSLTHHHHHHHHHHLVCRRWKHTPSPMLHWAIVLLSHGNATLRVGLRQTYLTIPATNLQHLRSSNIYNVGSRQRASRRTMTTYRWNNPLLSVLEVSNMVFTSRIRWLAYQMIKVSVCGTCTL